MADNIPIQTSKTIVDKDVHTRRCDENKLQGQNEALLTLALEATSDGIWAWHVPTGKTYFSPRYFTMLGYEPDALPATFDTWASLLHPDDSERTKKIIQAHIESKSEQYEVEFRLRTKSGQWLWILGRGKVIERDAKGRPIRMVGSHVNIDTRKRAEQKLAEYREQLEKRVKERTLALEQTTSLLEATFNAIPDVLGVQDHAHRIIRYNASGYRFLNKTHEDVLGKRCFELIGRDKECEVCATSECYRTKKPASVERYEKALDAWLDVRAYPILDENGKLVKVIEHLRDISPSKKAEAENRRLNDQLQQAQKMESLGTLAGGIAHDFNNLLMGIQGRISLMSLDLDDYHPHLEHTKAIETYIRSATNLTKQLLGFARGGKYEVKPLDMNQLMIGSAAMFGRTHKEIEIHTKTVEGKLTVEVDPRQFEQVFLNLYINAWQAMLDGGKLYLETKAVSLDERYCKPHQAAPGKYAKVSITDTGIGMDKATCRKIFDPFFTTKEKGRGTGLGLASAYGILKNHNGFITVYSEISHGTTFNFYLPLSEKEVYHDLPASEGLYEGSESILLVDDEEMIIDVGKAMLQKLGYQVVVAKGGEQALEKLAQNMDQIDLVILDMIMPGMDGGKTFDRIREIKAEIPVILSSGYTINDQASAIMRRGCNGFIQKPFNMAELSEIVRRIIDS
jgi:two-component system cell cycle sensor histidine kinase/response regulator CckA